MMRSLKVTAVVVAAGAACSPAPSASIIHANTATASTQFSASYAPTLTINGSGLNGPACPNTEHAAYTTNNHWTTANGTNPIGQNITWGFNTPQTLNRVHIWNHQSTPSHAANPFYDVTLFDLEVRDSANTIIYSVTNQAMLPDTATAQTYTFESTLEDVKTVKFTVRQTQGSTTYTGLAEVLFESPLPEIADLNLDGQIDTADLVRFLGQFGRTVEPGAIGDFNSDGSVDTADLVYFLGRFGQGCA